MTHIDNELNAFEIRLNKVMYCKYTKWTLKDGFMFNWTKKKNFTIIFDYMYH